MGDILIKVSVIIPVYGVEKYLDKCVSEDAKKSFIKKYNCCSENVKTIYNINIVLQILSVFIVIFVAHFALEICRFLILKIKAEKVLNILFGFRSRKVG